jgi:hypothetical protein
MNDQSELPNKIQGNYKITRPRLNEKNHLLFDFEEFKVPTMGSMQFTYMVSARMSATFALVDEKTRISVGGQDSRPCKSSALRKKYEVKIPPRVAFIDTKQSVEIKLFDFTGWSPKSNEEIVCLSIRWDNILIENNEAETQFQVEPVDVIHYTFDPLLPLLSPQSAQSLESLESQAILSFAPFEDIKDLSFHESTSDDGKEITVNIWGFHI